MVKLITIKSDAVTLEEIRKDTLLTAKKTINELSNKKIKYYLIFSSLLVISLLLFLINNKFLILTYISIFLLLFNLINDLNQRVKIWFLFRKYNKEYGKFIKKHKGSPFVRYKIFEEKIEYDGEEKIEFKWSEFNSISEDDNCFRLNTQKEYSKIWIPKSAITNLEDYNFFVAYAKSKINNES